MVQWLLFIIGKYIALALPLGACYRLAEWVGTMRCCLSRSDREAVLGNLNVIMPLSTSRERQFTACRVFVNFCKYLVDFLRSSRVDRHFVSTHSELVHLSRLKQALGRGRGVIIVTAHLGNWELGGGVLSRNGYPIHAVALPHKFPPTDRFFNYQRQLMGVTIIPTGVAVKRCFSLLKEKKIVAMLGDRDFSGGGCETDFLGARAIVPRGPVVFARKTGALLLPMFGVRQKDESLRIIIEEPIDPWDDRDRPRDEAVLLKETVAVIESYVREYPDQWYLFQPYFNGESVHSELSQVKR
jgi:KDO2-lipid IV(A) lauroyltransferase